MRSGTNRHVRRRADARRPGRDRRRPNTAVDAQRQSTEYVQRRRLGAVPLRRTARIQRRGLVKPRDADAYRRVVQRENAAARAGSSTRRRRTASASSTLRHRRRDRASPTGLPGGHRLASLRRRPTTAPRCASTTTASSAFADRGRRHVLPADATLTVGRYGRRGGLDFNGSIDEVADLQLRAVGGRGRGALRGGAAASAATARPDRPRRRDPAASTRRRARACPATRSPASTDANARRIIAYGLRNPFRITFRPGTNELWVGDVGWNTWEEINRIPNATDAVAENFGWPCYEGVARQAGYDGANLNLCETLYAQGPGRVAAPFYTYNHSGQGRHAETCPTGSSSITGMAFYPETGGSFPAALPRRPVLRRPQPELHLVHAEGHERRSPTRRQIQTFFDARRASRRPRHRAGRRPVLRRLRRRHDPPGHVRPAATSRRPRSSRPRRRAARRR